MFDGWKRVRDPLLDALFTPFPPVVSGLRLLHKLGASGALDFARLAVMPVRRLGEEQFRGQGGRLLLTGNAMHADVAPGAAGSGVLGWLLSMLAQDVGFPVPQGGAQALADALASRVAAGGGVVRTASRVEGVEVRGGRASGVRLADGTTIGARRAILADVAAPHLYRQLLDEADLPLGVSSRLDRFQWDDATLKVNWALGEPLGQMTTADPTRSPAGTESVWAYTTFPAGARRTLRR